MTFPIVPDNLRGLSDQALQELIGQFATVGAEFAALTGDALTEEVVEQMDQLAELSGPVVAERERRDRFAASQARLTELSAPAEPEAPTEPQAPVEPEVAEPPAADPAAVEPVAPGVVAAAPRVADVASSTQPQAPVREGQPQSPRLRASMVAAVDVPGVPAQTPLTSFGQAARVVQNRLDAYSMTGKNKTIRKAPRASKVIDVDVTSVEDVDRAGRFRNVDRHKMKTFSRHQAVNFKREYPDELRLSSENGAEFNLRAMESAVSEKRLTGGSLVAALEAEVKQTGNLVAATGWCAPSETIYDLCEQESLDGLLAVPEVTADRGGFNIPIDGGIDFSTIFTSIGNAGDTHLTEAEVAIPTEKVCTEIPCPPFEDIRLGVDYVCITGGLLQRRGYPEVVQRFSRGAMIALAHKINQGVIAGIEAGSVDGGTMEDCLGAGGDDALGSLLSAAEAAREDILYRARMPFATSMEMILPHWVIPQLRAAAARRRGVFEMMVSDAELLSFFTARRLVPRFVYDWQDAFSDGGVGGMGGLVPRTALPTEVRFIMYPAGTWLKATADVVNLDTIYDSTLLTTNQYTAIFVEDGWAVMQMCPISRVFTVRLDPCGCLCEASSVIESP
jgi:hypothetical protein